MKRLILFSITISLGLVSCKKQEQTTTPIDENSSSVFDPMSLLGSSSTTPSYGTISLSATKYGFESSAGTIPQFNSNGDFFSTSNRLPADRIEVGNISNGLFTLSPNLSNSLNYTYNSTQKDDQSNATLFGSTVTFSATGSTTYGIPAFSQNVYNPSILSVTGTFTGGVYNAHSNSQPIVINWNSDANNPYTDIVIALQYQTGPSVRLNASNPTSVALKTYVVSDANGTFTIPSSDLALFPQNCVMNIHIIRGNDEVITVNGNDYDFLCYTHVQQEFELQ
jgi:hypothetical protein